MTDIGDVGRLSKEQLKEAMARESEQFEEYYLWLEKHMPPRFFEETEQKHVMLIAHNLMGFEQQDYFTHIYLKGCAFVLCLDSPDVDLRVLKHYNLYGIKNYQTHLSDTAPPFPGVDKKLRIAAIYFTTITEDAAAESCDIILSEKLKHDIYDDLKESSPDLSYNDFRSLVCGMNARFLRTLTPERLKIALKVYFQAQTRDHCQYEVHRNENWAREGKNVPSMVVFLAWRNTPKHHFLYRLAKTIFRHNLVMLRANATYINPYDKNSTLIMAIGLHGMQGKAAWEETDVEDLLQEIVTLKYFDFIDRVESTFVDPGLVRGNLGNFIRCMIDYVHQILVHADPYLYSYGNIEEGVCRHPEITVQLCEMFELKFNPKNIQLGEYKKKKKKFLDLVDHLDTGHEVNDIRRKNILKQSLQFIQFSLKTNFYLANKSAIAFRIDPEYLDHVPYDRVLKFPENPYGIFFIKGMHFVGFHIRFKDLARGGLRTVIPQRLEQMTIERNNSFSECYNLAYTQQKKNKDIPEGGAKAVILLEPFERLQSESDIYRKEMKWAGLDDDEITKRLAAFKKEQKLEYLYQTQRSFVHTLLTLVNCDEEGILRENRIVDYWKRPEYLYLGPDENMHNVMIEWIAEYAKKTGYRPGSAFISSKPKAGINHKEYGVTSFGVNVYMEEMLKFIGINPTKDPFTIKISGGPDGDVAGNQILNLAHNCPKTAKLIALVDVSGTIYDPEGLDLPSLVELFKQVEPIRNYPPEELHDGGFLLDLQTKQDLTAYAQQTLCYKKSHGKLEKTWLTGSEMNYLFRTNVHQAKTDIFIPAGGRPRTLHETNLSDFLDKAGVPTSRAIVEGANLYFTPGARRKLEELGVLIIKDSSANKGGVICSSFEILSGLTLDEENFIENKNELMEEILQIIREKALDEANLLLNTHEKTKAPLSEISEWISERINTYTYQILDHLDPLTLPTSVDDPLMNCLLNYSPPFLRKNYPQALIEKIPDHHKKAIIACYIAAKVVYKKGLDWSPSVVDVLPLLTEEPQIQSRKIKDRDIEII